MMKPALVTGASGFLGWHVARVLLEHGLNVRALVRPGSRVDALDVECVTGDLRDPASLQRAVAGCGLLFHVAADYRLWAKDPTELYRSNVDGTRNLLEAARQGGVERVVYTSTVGCIGVPPGGVGDESVPVKLVHMAGDYKRSKFLAEKVALEFARSGLPIVVVNPTAPVGDHDVKPTPTGKIVLDFLNGAMPAFIDTGLNVVDVRDTAEGHWLACQRGVSGERYILGSENLTLAQILQKLARLTGRKAPTVRLPYAVAYCARRMQHRLGRHFRQAAAYPARSGTDGEEKDVGLARKSGVPAGISRPAPADQQALAHAVEWFSAVHNPAA